MEELFTYIIVYGSEVGPHLFYRYIPERIDLREVTNQTSLNKQAQKLTKFQKKIWPNFLINFGNVCLKDREHAFKEAEELNHVWFYSLTLPQYEPQGIINYHYSVASYKKTYTHLQPLIDEFFFNIDNFHQAFKRGQLLSREDRSKMQEFRQNV